MQPDACLVLKYVCNQGVYLVDSITHPSGVGTGDCELEELENFEREYVQSSDQEVGIDS